MKKPDEQVVQALSALKMNDYFKRLVQWIQESRDEQRDANDSELDDVRLRQGQGRSQQLTDFLDTLAGADDTRRRFVDQARHGGVQGLNAGD